MKKRKILSIVAVFAMILGLATGQSNVKIDAATTVNNFSDLKAAVEAGGEVTLGADIVLTEGLIVTKTLTVNLNGKKLTNTVDIWEKPDKNACAYFNVRAGGDLTINGEGTLQTKANDCYAVSVYNGGNCTLNGGTYVGNISAVYVTEGSAVINGGTYSIQQIFKPEKPCTLTINCLDKNYQAGTAKITVNGGTFNKFNPGNDEGEGPNTNLLGQGVSSIKDGENYVVVKDIVEGDVNVPTAPTPTKDTVVTGVNPDSSEVIKNAGNALIETISANETSDEAVSDADLAAIKQALLEDKEIGVKVVANNMEEESVDASVIANIKDIMDKKAGNNKVATIAQFLDLRVMVTADGNEIASINKLSDEIEFEVAIPTDLLVSGRNFYVIKNHDGEISTIDCTLTNGILKFKTDEFSIYTLVYEDTKTTTNNGSNNNKPAVNTTTNAGNGVETGDHTNMALWIALLIGSIDVFAIMALNKKRNLNK